MKLNKLFYGILMGCAMLIGTTACEDDDNNSNGELVLDAPVVTDIVDLTAEVSANVIVSPKDLESGVVRVMAYGFCYSTSPAPTIYQNTVSTYLNDEEVSQPILPNTNGKITAALEDLERGVVYYVRAFATLYPNGVVYSAETQFTVGEPTELDTYKAPGYADSYTDIAGWDQRSQWNLANVHDPTVMKADDGYYYMYQTDASYGNAHTQGGHFHGRRSKDLVNWEYLGGTMMSAPTWIVPKMNELRALAGLPAVTQNSEEYGYWAPCVRKVRSGLYRMYYSIIVNNYSMDATRSDASGERAFIGLMETSDPSDNNSWVDKGYVISNATERGLNFYNWSYANCYYKWNAIDPSYIIDKDGKNYLIYGSWHSGIAAVELDPATGKPYTLGNWWGNSNADIASYGKLIATRQMGNRWQASEGPEVVYNPATGYYYLFLAYDNLEVAYNTRVARSTNIYGPYVGIDGKDITTSGGDLYPIVTHPYKFNKGFGWVGISHCAIFDDGSGNWYYASQGRLPVNVGGNEFSNYIMMGHVRSIRWTSDGWPLVMPERYGAVPQLPITQDELIGKWEHIDLGYSFDTQKTSSNMTLAADGKVTNGTWKDSSWSYDADKQILTIDGVELYLQRETDWEATPRRHTIVYAGYSGINTYWGKKSK